MAARDIDVFVKKGTPSGDPTVTPSLQRDYIGVRAYDLAKILVPANAYDHNVAGNIDGHTTGH